MKHYSVATELRLFLVTRDVGFTFSPSDILSQVTTPDHLNVLCANLHNFVKSGHLDKVNRGRYCTNAKTIELDLRERTGAVAPHTRKYVPRAKVERPVEQDSRSLAQKLTDQLLGFGAMIEELVLTNEKAVAAAEAARVEQALRDATEFQLWSEIKRRRRASGKSMRHPAEFDLEVKRGT